MKKIALIVTSLIIGFYAIGQDKTPVTRIARITIDPSQVEVYMRLLKEQIETAVHIEPGVLGYKVYVDKADPARLTIIEVYADNNAYLTHLQTAHFKKYKTAVADIVKSLELSEVDAILTAGKKTHNDT